MEDSWKVLASFRRPIVLPLLALGIFMSPVRMILGSVLFCFSNSRAPFTSYLDRHRDRLRANPPIAEFGCSSSLFLHLGLLPGSVLPPTDLPLFSCASGFSSGGLRRDPLFVPDACGALEESLCTIQLPLGFHLRHRQRCQG